MYLQQIPLFGKFCFYGCYCFPNLGSDFTVGKGKPVDDVDMKCRDFSSCYKCLAIDYKETCTHTQPYSFEGKIEILIKNRKVSKRISKMKNYFVSRKNWKIIFRYWNFFLLKALNSETKKIYSLDHSNQLKIESLSFPVSYLDLT